MLSFSAAILFHMNFVWQISNTANIVYITTNCLLLHHLHSCKRDNAKPHKKHNYNTNAFYANDVICGEERTKNPTIDTD